MTNDFAVSFVLPQALLLFRSYEGVQRVTHITYLDEVIVAERKKASLTTPFGTLF